MRGFNRFELQFLYGYCPTLKQIEVFDYNTTNFKTLKRIPFVWEDDMEFLNNQNWSLDKLKKNKGITILNFHPIHVFLNSSNSNNYNEKLLFVNNM